MQDPAAAANELERCVRDLGFCGALINGHTNGDHLDHPKFYGFWERAEGIGVPIYLHPADPVSSYPAIAGCAALKRAMWEWSIETGSHALRLVFGGIFDRFPGVTLVLGHLGETCELANAAFGPLCLSDRTRNRPGKYSDRGPLTAPA